MCCDCAKRAQCAQPCEYLLNELEKVTGKGNGREILVSHETLKFLYTTKNPFSLAHLQKETVEIPLGLLHSFLTEKQVEVMLLHYEEQQSFREIAKILNISKTGVEMRLKCIRKKLLLIFQEQILDSL